MTATLQRNNPTPSTPSSTSSAQWLRQISAAVKVAFTWFGIRKTLTPEQKTQAAEPFGAEGDYLSARKKLLDTHHPAYKDVTAMRGKIGSYWKCLTLPFPEPGVRLIRQEHVEEFNQQMTALRQELLQAVASLDQHYSELKQAARRRLGELFNPSDYPSSLIGLFDLSWEFPNLEPPNYLLHLDERLYEQEKQRVAARFEEAVRLAEEAFLSEFARLVSHLTERLSVGEDGQRKVFRDSILGNLTEFFTRFRDLNVRSNPELDDLVAQAQRLVEGVQPQELRTSDALRQHISAQMASVVAQVDGMLVDQPRRRILRSRAPEERGQG